MHAHIKNNPISKTVGVFENSPGNMFWGIGTENCHACFFTTTVDRFIITFAGRDQLLCRPGPTEFM
jgi:hypothetical protein